MKYFANASWLVARFVVAFPVAVAVIGIVALAYRLDKNSQMEIEK